MSKTIYTHIHHIVPKHMGGTDDPDNLIELTVEEHAEAHRKLYEKHGLYQDKIAWLALSGQIDSQEATRRIQSETMKNRIYTDEIRKNMSEGQKGKKYNRKGKCSGEKNNFYGKSHTEEYKKRKSELMTGKKLSEETRQKMSEAKKGVPKPKLTCPHCGKNGGAPQMKRHHFNNCKENIRGF